MVSSTPIRVVVLDDYQGVAKGLANWQSPRHPLDVTFVRNHIDGEDALAQVLGEATVIVAMRERTPLSAQLLTRLPKLRLIVTTGMRNDSIEQIDGVTLCGTDGLTTPTVELTWALILGLSRHLRQEEGSLRAGTWQTTIGEGLQGRTLGLLGLGKIGTLVAGVGQAFGMRVIAWSQNLTAEHAQDRGVERVSADGLFAQADVLSVHLRLSRRSRDLVDRSRLRQMSSEALLINTSRAEIINQHALLEALNQGWIAGAGIDVYDSEPLPPGHPLLAAQHTLLTPHLGYVVRQNYEIFYRGVLEAIEAYFDEQPIRVINPSA